MKSEGVYYVYIVTNPGKTVLYTGMTNDLQRRLMEHYCNRGNRGCFAGRYHAYHLIYYEIFQFVSDAIAREKEIKGWRREKKMKMIMEVNEGLDFLEFSFL